MLNTACAMVYIAPSAHTPLFSEPDQLNGAVNFGTHGWDLKAAYSIPKTEGLAVLVGSSWEAESGLHEHKYGEAGVGYYKAFGYGRFEAYGGGGMGESRGRAEYTLEGQDYEGTSSGNYYRGFVQANIAFSSEFADVGFAWKASYVNYYFDMYRDEPIGERHQTIFVEPTVFAAVGSDPVKFTMQAGVIWPPMEQIVIEWVPIHLSIGLSVTLDHLFGTETD